MGYLFFLRMDWVLVVKKGNGDTTSHVARRDWIARRERLQHSGTNRERHEQRIKRARRAHA